VQRTADSEVRKRTSNAEHRRSNAEPTAINHGIAKEADRPCARTRKKKFVPVGCGNLPIPRTVFREANVKGNRKIASVGALASCARIHLLARRSRDDKRIELRRGVPSAERG